jgi:16S rRNA (guanine1207-N2)-methyltransferase
VFAGRRLDEGTALLLSALPELKPGDRVLDYGCGSGVIGYSMLRRQPAARLVLLDPDTVALAAARENLPAARTVAGVRLADAGPQRFQAILSNPPIHVGKQEDRSALKRLVAEAPEHLTPGGALQIVVQRRVPVEPMLQIAFRLVEQVAKSASFCVYRARAS